MKNIARILINGLKEMHEDCIKSVLRELLKREPAIEDAKKTTLIMHNYAEDKYTILYEGIELGLIHTVFYLNGPIVEFLPNKHFK